MGKKYAVVDGDVRKTAQYLSKT